MTASLTSFARTHITRNRVDSAEQRGTEVSVATAEGTP